MEKKRKKRMGKERTKQNGVEHHNFIQYEENDLHRRRRKGRQVSASISKQCSGHGRENELDPVDGISKSNIIIHLENQPRSAAGTEGSEPDSETWY